jgi:hypothetical protein
MKMLKKVNAIFLGLATLLAFGCGGDEVEPTPVIVANNPADQKCQLTQMKYTRGTDPDSLTSVLEYNAAGKISKATGYQGGRSFTEIGTYNAAGQLIRLDHSYGSYQLFDYNNLGLRSKVSYYRVSSPGGPASLDDYKTYAYDSNKKLIKISSFDPSQGNILTGTEEFTYPSATSAKQEDYDNSRRLLVTTDYTFDDKIGLDHLLGEEFGLVSDHNVLTETVNNGSSVYNLGYTYEYNADGYPTKKRYTTDGVTSPDIFTFSYNCK